MWWLLLGCPKPVEVVGLGVPEPTEPQAEPVPDADPVSEPEPVPDADPGSDADPVAAIEPREWFELSPRPFQPAAFTPVRTVDVVFAALEGVRITRNDVVPWCDVPCVLPHVAPGEVIAVWAEDGPSKVEVDLVTPWPAQPVALEGTTRLLPHIPDSDARGAAYVGSFTLNSPADVTLRWRAVHEGSEHHGVHQPALAVYGARGGEQAHTMATFDPPDQDEAIWTLDAGTWFVRGTLEDRVSRWVCEDRERVPVAPAWCDPAPDTGIYLIDVALEVAYRGGLTEEPTLPPAKVPALDVGLHTLAAAVPPEPASRAVQVPVGQDLVLRWSPRAAALLYDWKIDEDRWSRGVCTEWPCVFPAAPFEAITLSTSNVAGRAEPVRVEVFSLPPPPPRTGLQPGYVLSTVLREVEGDPRPAFTDIAIPVEVPGTYRLGVKVEQGTPPAIEPLPGAWSQSMLNLMGGDPTYDAVFMEVDAPGTFVARVTACEGCAPQPIQFELQAE